MMCVLDHGFIALEEIAGGDAAVVRAARLCWKSEGDGLGPSDAKLIRSLMEKGHGTPFEHTYLRWFVRCPIFVARQWMRHRIGSFNERSLRYTAADMVYYVPRGMPQELLEKYHSQCQAAFGLYKELKEEGVPQEQARGVLPLATYTEFVWSVNARAFMHWLGLRLQPGAQWEHRAYAHAAYEDWKEYMPITAEAFSLHYGLPKEKKDATNR